jgi:two-component system chemotaxis response regulator CheB
MQQLQDGLLQTSESKIYAPRAVVVIGASTGGPASLAQILPKFPKNFQASIIVIQQMRPGFTKALAGHLNGISKLRIEEAQHYQPISVGAAHIAPGNCTVTFEKSSDSQGQRFLMRVQDTADSMERMKKRINDAMISAAEQFGSRTIGVLLTGIGDDGRDGMKEIRNRGGKTLAQDEVTSTVFEMPRTAIDAGVIDEVLPLWNISDRVIEIVGDR